MAETVVHLLEVVEVHEQHRERLAGAAYARDFGRQPIAQHPERREAGERVHRRLLLRRRRLLLEIRRGGFQPRPAAPPGRGAPPARPPSPRAPTPPPPPGPPPPRAARLPAHPPPAL